jgi:hypothetical protein
MVGSLNLQEREGRRVKAWRDGQKREHDKGSYTVNCKGISNGGKMVKIAGFL